MKAESDQNNLDKERLLGSYLVYGQAIQIIHKKSMKYLVRIIIIVILLLILN